ncbi:heme-binding protein soul3 [Astyanax mexicanus]|uniref:Heme-binding protein 1-like n=2 Tax=Astyanax mexicanus TaxID=7994 RepID=A0A8B9LJW9_ASTMX|nr:heme-binding protein soul3 [Astyanax mexicanus]KAG9268225.1 heme-binding protein 1-like [Astyanax mexicanus]
MDHGNCRLNGGGGGGESQAGGSRGSESSSYGMITLEDLESFSEDQLSDSGNGSLEEEGEMMEDEDQNDQLLNYWQTVGRGHRVDVPRDMAEPIQQITSNNNGSHPRETVPYTFISCKEKCGIVLYEKRHYEKANWACITVKEDTYEQSICYGFMRIMRYICQQNSLGRYLGMTIPIVTVVHTDETHATLSQTVTIAYYLPADHQAQPPQPHDTEIVIEQWPATIVYTRPFTGATNETTIISEINALAEVLDSPGICDSDSFIVAGYTNPAAANRQNEIWFLERP